ncbi:uncharacterized protein [Panulirus ornatus]
MYLGRVAWWRRRVAVTSIMAVAVLVVAAAGDADEVKARQYSTPGMDLLEQFLQSSPELLCGYVHCQEPVPPSKCPHGTSYLQGVAQFGCCGACVRFKQMNDEKCTGSIDPRLGGGYTPVEGRLPHQFLESEQPSNLPSNTVQSSWCDYYLRCDNDTRVCVPDEVVGDCRYVQDMYDSDMENGLILYYRDDYRWRPDCTPEGYYREKQIKGPYDDQRSVCVDPDGVTIYGKAFPWQTDLFTNANCKCSRRVWERQQAGSSTVTLHCKENGNYEPMQCEDGWCYCVQPDTATPYGAFLPEDAMDLLPCYNKTLTGQQYLRRCESQYHAHQLLIEHMRAKGVMGSLSLVRCDADGSYSGEQCDLEMCRCYDKYDLQIAQPSGGGCNCARDRWLYGENNIIATFSCTSPDQAVAGVYSSIQHFGNSAYCVDADGVRTGPMVDSQYASLLDCVMAAQCQMGNTAACSCACQECPITAYVKYQM